MPKAKKEIAQKSEIAQRVAARMGKSIEEANKDKAFLVSVAAELQAHYDKRFDAGKNETSMNKNAKVVMQNLFFETPEELQKYQDMNKKNNPGAGKQLGDFKDDLPPMDKNKAPGMGEEGLGEEDGDGLAPSSLSYEDYEKGKAKEQKSLSKRIEREVKDQVQSALERKIASTFDETDDELIDAMRKKGRTWDEIKNYYIKKFRVRQRKRSRFH